VLVTCFGLVKKESEFRQGWGATDVAERGEQLSDFKACANYCKESANNTTVETR
jgi:hypothetical protein